MGRLTGAHGYLWLCWCGCRWDTLSGACVTVPLQAGAPGQVAMEPVLARAIGARQLSGCLGSKCLRHSHAVCASNGGGLLGCMGTVAGCVSVLSPVATLHSDS